MKINLRIFPIICFLSALPTLSGCGDEVPNQYQSTLPEGIDFKRDGYPSFLIKVSGVDGREDWGRWTNANLSSSVQLRFKNPLPKKFTLELQVIPFGSNREVQITIGTDVQNLKLNHSDSTYALVFENPNGCDLIEITPQQHISPKELNPTSTDTRKIGLGLISLKIKELK